MITRSSLLGCLTAALLLSAYEPAPAFAAVSVGPRDSIQIAGFLSQGYLQTSHNSYPIGAEDGTFLFREMGLSASTTLGSHVRLGAQLFAQRFGPFGDDQVKLDWAVIDYNVRQEFGIRVGRVKYPKGLYGEALDLDVVRPFIFLPLSLYSPILRDFSASFDGAMIYGTVDAGRFGSLDYKGFYGDIPMDPEQGVAEFFTTTGLFKMPTGVTSLGMDYVTGASLDWSTPLSGLKVHASHSYFKNVHGNGLFAYVPFATAVNVAVDQYAYTTFSLEYAVNAWTFASEWQRQGGNATVRTAITPPDFSKTGTDNLYLSAARRLGSRWELGGYVVRSQNRNASSGTARERRQSDDYAVSIRHDLNDHALIKLEWHYVDGQFGLFNTPRVSNPTASRKNHSSFFAAKTTLSF